ncbi:hypothetical protein [Streptomyces sp. NPDC051994]
MSRNLDQKADRLDGPLDEFGQQMDRNQAQITQLLTELVGRRPNAS